MPAVIHIDGLPLESPATTVTIEKGATLAGALDGLGAKWHIEHVPDEAFEREISVDAAAFIASYKRDDPSAVLAVFWRYYLLEAEEFETAEEARRFLEMGSEYGDLAGEAIVDGDQITVLD
jgi:hypothetical protein